MSQNDYVIANQTAPNFRADLNLALQALASNSSGATAPATTYANMLWYDTAANTLYMRSEADDAWITLGTLDQSLNTFTPAGIATQSTAVWEAGIDTTESLVSAAKVAAAIQGALGGPTVPFAHDVQVFTSSGTWTKPANAVSGDRVVIWCVGGGGGGRYTTASGVGGGGGGGAIWRGSLDDLPASESVTVGAGGLGATTVNTNSSSGGDTDFGTSGAGATNIFLRGEGGTAGGITSGGAGGDVFFGRTDNDTSPRDVSGFVGGAGGVTNEAGNSSMWGGGGGGGISSFNGSSGGFSGHAGHGGQGIDNFEPIADFRIDGEFPGGGGGAATNNLGGTRGGNGGDGICVVMCFRNVYPA